MNYEPLCTLKESALQQASENTRNKLILAAYETIVTRISNLIERDFNRAWKKFPRFEKHEIKEANIIREFYTPHCSVKLLVRRMNYIIILTTTEQSFNAGSGIRSTELIRVGFEATRYEQQGFMIQNALELKVDNNINAVYKQKFDERVDSQNLLYFNKKMGD